MRQCPQCQKIIKKVAFSGWVLKVEGAATFNEEGDVDQISPLTPTITIKKGKELDGYLTEATCPECGFIGKSSLFTRVHICWFTGKFPAQQTINIPGLGIKYYAAEHVDSKQIAELLQIAETFSLISPQAELALLT